MAEQQFQGKGERVGNRKSFRYQIKHSLGFRVMFICVLTMLIPAFIYSFRLTYKFYLSKVREVADELILIGSTYEREMEHLIQLQEKNLATWTMFPAIQELIKEEKPCVAYCSFFKKIAERQALSSLFFVKEDPQTGKLVYFVSTAENSVGKEVFFVDEINKIKENSGTAFLAYDPLTKQKEILFVYAVRDDAHKILGYLISGVPAEKTLMTAFSEVSPYPFDVSLLDRNGDIFISSNPTILLSDLRIVSLEAIREEENAAFPFFQTERNISGSILFNRTTWFGLKLPVESTDFYFLIDIPDKKILSEDTRAAFIYVIIGFFSLFILGAYVAIWITKRMAKPLLSLSSLMEKVGQGTLQVQYFPDKWGFEINELGQNFNRMIASLENYIGKAHEEKIAKETLEKELKIGYEIQKTILPRSMPHIPGIDLAAGFVPAKEVGGDFYDVYFKENQKKLVLSIADTSGKGISACLYSIVLRSILRSFDCFYDNVADVAKSSNDLFSVDTSDTGMFVTAWLGVYDIEAHKITYTCCGHLPALLCKKNGEIVELSTPGMALGVTSIENIKVNSVDVSSGDFILLYTDGIIEAHDKEDNLFGKKKLLDLLAVNKGLAPDQLIALIMKEVDKFSEGRPRHDDVTMLVMKVQ